MGAGKDPRRRAPVPPDAPRWKGGVVIELFPVKAVQVLPPIVQVKDGVDDAQIVERTDRLDRALEAGTREFNGGAHKIDLEIVDEEANPLETINLLDTASA